ncbi:MAG: L-glutamate gamma-semialdehyde dehydrogenase [Actinomycetes bacterium]
MQRVEAFDAVSTVPAPYNEPVRPYGLGDPGRAELATELARVSSRRAELGMVIGDEVRLGRGEPIEVVMPHRHAHVLGVLGNATTEDAADAIGVALAAASGWRGLSFDDRAAVFLRAADLLTGPWRTRMTAATMLGQSKTVYQAEIDAVAELADFWRFNVAFARGLLAEQPMSVPGTWNRTDHRPLEGFVYAITPFNFTSIAGNLPTAPALMGNVVLWKPAPTAQLAAQVIMDILRAAGLPPGVITMVTGDGLAVSEVALRHPGLAGIHFTGSTATFQRLWRTVGENIVGYRSYPRLVGETGGKDFILAHTSADPQVLTTALVRGAFEYQGQKCSAASRAYIPRSLWSRMGEEFLATVESLPMGDPADLSKFLGALIDRRAYDKLGRVLAMARSDSSITVLAGGTADDTEGYFVRPTVLAGADPRHEIFTTEYFGPVLGVYVYDDAEYDRVIAQLESVSPYALTGAVVATDRQAIAQATASLRFAAGNFYVNDKPTGAVVGQQPFGGARASGTDDKAGSTQNLLRWTSTRVVKETFVPATQWRYPHMGTSPGD